MPGEVVVVDPHPGEAQNVDPLFPATEYTAQQILAAQGSVPAGGATAANQTTEIAGLAAILAKIIAAPATEASLAALLAKFPALLGQTTKNNSLSVATASNDGLYDILGSTTGAAVVTDANGSLQQYLRGLVKLAVGAGLRTLDAGPAWATDFGVGGELYTSADLSGGPDSVTDLPVVGQKLVITDVEISVDTAMRVDLSCAGTIIASVYMAANSTVNLITRSKRKLPVVDSRLRVQTSVEGNISVGVFYYSEA